MWWSSGELVADPAARLPGRGAYVHPSRSCLDLAVRRRAFARALRHPGPLDEAALRRHLEAQDLHDPHDPHANDQHVPSQPSTGSRSRKP